MRTRAVILIVLLASLLSSCSVPEQVAPPVTLTLSPEAITVDPGASVEFEALVVAAEPQPLAWKFADGSLSAAGYLATYTAPVAVGDYEISVAIPGEGLSATATVTVAEPHPLSPGITLSPDAGTAKVATGLSLDLTAVLAETLTGASTDDLIWEVNGGSISAQGGHAIYTAPHTPGYYIVSASIPGVEDAFGSLVIDVPGALLEPFTIAVIPDTQTLVLDGDSRHLIVGTAQWLVDNAEDRDIAFVSQLGDVVWGDHWRAKVDTATQWTAALEGLDLLDGVMPYSVSLGDHEYEKEADKASSTDAFHEYFGPDRYAAYDWYGGAHEDGLSHYQIFEAGGRKFLHLNLEWEPMGPADDVTTPLGWARSVLEAHPHLPTFISTHAYLWDMPEEEGHFPDEAREAFFGDDDSLVTTSGVGIFEALVEPFSQVLMVFNGHYHKADGSSSEGEYHQTSVNASGSLVYEMLSNYQWMNYSNDPDWIRLIEFVPAAGDEPDRIEVSTFSPSRADTGSAYRTQASSSFSFELDLAERLAFD